MQEVAVSSAVRFNSLALFKGDSGWKPLPIWAKYFVQIGASLASKSSSNWLLAIATPSPAYASVFCCAGVVLERLSLHCREEALQHFSYLSSLRSGTVVNYRRDKVNWKGTLIKCIRDNDRPSVLIQIRENGRIEVPIENLLRVRVASQKPKVLPSRAQTIKRNDILAALTSNNGVDKVNNGRLDALILGSEARLRNELLLPIAIRSAESLVEGPLSSALMVRRMLDDGDVFRSEIAPTSLAASLLHTEDPWAVIFDGAAPFLRSGISSECKRAIVVMSYLDARFEDAVAEINRISISRAGNPLFGLPSPPPGVEIRVLPSE